MRVDRLGGSGGLFRLCRSQRRPAAGLLPGHRRRRGAVDRHVSVAAKLQRAGVSPPGAADVSRRRRMDAGVPDRLRRDVLSQARRPRVARLDGRMVRARALRARARACAPLALRRPGSFAPGGCSSAPSSSAADRSAENCCASSPRATSPRCACSASSTTAATIARPKRSRVIPSSATSTISSSSRARRASTW